jgi:hypothetical protein
LLGWASAAHARFGPNADGSVSFPDEKMREKYRILFTFLSFRAFFADNPLESMYVKATPHCKSCAL